MVDLLVEWTAVPMVGSMAEMMVEKKADPMVGSMGDSKAGLMVDWTVVSKDRILAG